MGTRSGGVWKVAYIHEYYSKKLRGGGGGNLAENGEICILGLVYFLRLTRVLS